MFTIIKECNFNPLAHTHTRTVSLGMGAVGEVTAVHFVQNVKYQHFLYQREK